MKPLSDTQLLVIQAGIMNDTDKGALKYLETSGHKMSRMTYWRHQTKLQETATIRLYNEAKGAVQSQMKIIDELETVKKQLWKLFSKNGVETIEQIRILREIRELIPHITAAKAAIPHVIKEVIQNFQREGTEPRRDKPTVITAK